MGILNSLWRWSIGRPTSVVVPKNAFVSIEDSFESFPPVTITKPPPVEVGPPTITSMDPYLLQELEALSDAQSLVAESAVGIVQSVYIHVSTDCKLATKVAKQVSRVSTELDQARQRVDEASSSTQSLNVAVTRLNAALGSVRSIAVKSEDVRRLAEDSRLVALNATIESAHAGEQGKGFAVVAGAVRTLATESAHVATDISDTLATGLKEFEAVAREIRSAMKLSTEAVHHARELISSAAECAQGISKSSSGLANRLRADEASTEAAKQNLADKVEKHAQRATSLLNRLQGSDISELEPQAVAPRLSKFIVIDVRRSDEFHEGYLDCAEHIALDEGFALKLESFDPASSYLFVCRSGGRSSRAARIAVEQGFTSVHNLVGGMQRWYADMGETKVVRPPQARLA